MGLDISSKTKVLFSVSRFIDTDSGVPMAISDEVGNVTTKVPNPGYEALHERLLRVTHTCDEIPIPIF